MTIRFYFEQYTNNLSIEARTQADKPVSIASLQKTTTDDPVLQRAYQLLAAAASRREENTQATARVEGLLKHTDFQLLNALRALSQEDPQATNASFEHKPLQATIDLDTKETLALHAPIHGTNQPLNQTTLFGYEQLWGYTKDLHLFELDLRHAGVLTQLSKRCREPIPATFTKTFLEQNYHNEGKLGRVQIDQANTIQTQQHTPTPRIYLSENGDELQMQLRFAYGQQEIPAHDNKELYHYSSGQITRTPRDKKTEEFYKLQFKTNNVRATRDGYTPRNDAYEWLADDVQELLALGYEIYGKNNLVHHRITTEAKLRVETKEENNNWLELDVQATIGEEELPLDVLTELLRKGERYVKLADQTTGVIPQKWLDKLSHTIGLLQLKADGIHVQHTQLRAADALLETADEKQTSPDYNKLKKRLASFEELEEYAMPQHFQGELRDYQKVGYNWLQFLREYSFGGILADDMGLGKTVQMLAALAKYHEQNPTAKSLIVVPTSLVHNWDAERAKFTPQLTSHVQHGNRPQTNEEYAKIDAQLIITTYNTLRNDIELLSTKHFGYAILDESHAIKNPASQITKAVTRINAANKIAVTGTPIENSLDELWSQMNFANPGMLGGYDYFNKTYTDKDMHGELRALIKPFILQRTKDAVAKDLPPKQISVQYHEMSEEQARLYQATRAYYRDDVLEAIEAGDERKSQTAVFTGLLRLRQLANHPGLISDSYAGSSTKLDSLCEQLAELASEGHKALVFSSFVGLLDELQKRLTELRVLRLDGSTNNRQDLVDEFQEGATDVFLISLKAGGVGLTLTAADYVFILDPWWNPQAEMQAIDRAHRIGQKKPVFVYKMITKNTVEEKILAMQESKLELANNIIESESGIYKTLTKADIEYLFE